MIVRYLRCKESTMNNEVLNAAKLRRSVYALGKELPVTTDQVREIVEEALAQAPSPFNVQSSRAVILLDAAHEALWDHLLGLLKGIVKDPEAFAQTEAKLRLFRGARGSVLFFEDQTPIQTMQAQFPLYADKFPVWSLQASGMAQFLVWTAFAKEGIGANTQHYDPLVDEYLYETLGLPRSWKVISQMNFGGILAPAGEKSFLPSSERVRLVS